MLAALIIWGYLAAVFYLYGLDVLWLLRRTLRDPDSPFPSLPIILLVGLVCFGTLAAGLSLFLDLSWLAALILLAVALILTALVRPSLRLDLRLPKGLWLSAVVFLVAALVVLENGTHRPSNPDTNLYHAQTIRWIESYPAVPGLGNLNARLALNSDWLVLNAATSFAFLGLRSLHLLAGLLFLVVLLYFVGGLQGLARRRFNVSNWMKVLLLPLSLRVLDGEISSPGTDLPVVLLIWIVAALSVELLEGSSSPADPAGPASASSLQRVVLGILPAFAVTLKLSALPLLLLTAGIFLVLIARRRPAAAWTLAGLCALILLPWIARSMVLSGYVVFPYSRLDLFSFDWKMPASYVDEFRNGVIGFARLPDRNWTQAVSLPLQAWLPAWFDRQSLVQRPLIVGAFLSPMVLAFKEGRKYLVPFAVYYAGVLFWILTAPSLRFGYGFLFALLAFALAVLLVLMGRWLKESGRSSLHAVASALLIAVLGYLLVSSFDPATLPQRLLLPEDYLNIRTVSCPVDGLQVYCASAYRQCGYESFPCVPAIPPGLQARGDQLQDGFISLR